MRSRNQKTSGSLMVRKAQAKSLTIWMNGEHVGHWSIERARSKFTYSKEWLDKDGARPLSLSMPLRNTEAPYQGDVVEAFFDNLLPDSSEVRRRIQSRYRTSSIAPFDLLTEIGRDCVGAIQLMSGGKSPDGIHQINSEPVNDSEIANILRSTTSSTVLGQNLGDEFRISLAGAQEKTALLKHDGCWHRPLKSTPTTHLLKMPLGEVGGGQIDMSTSVENEWLCSKLVREFGLAVAPCEIADFDGQRVLVVERFDRKLSNDGRWWIRLPQEDMCQALGVAPDKKYQSDGGPGILEINKLLMASENSIQDRRVFFKAQVLFWMLCAIDGHAKNFSISIGPAGRFKLKPLYDVLSAYPFLGRAGKNLSQHKAKMAMAMLGNNKHYRWYDIVPRHLLHTAEKCGLAKTARDDISDLIELAPKAIETVEKCLPALFPDYVAQPIFDGIKHKANALKVLQQN